MSATEELKPCPFCGGDNLASNWHSPFIVCNDCGAFGPGNADSTHEQAVEAWNTRTPEQAIAATLDGGELTKEDVQRALFAHSTYANYDGLQLYASGIRTQEIADELNAALGGGECEVECFDDGVDEDIDGEWFSYAPPTWYLSCGHEVQGTERPNYCVVCGKWVKR